MHRTVSPEIISAAALSNDTRSATVVGETRPPCCRTRSRRSARAVLRPDPITRAIADHGVSRACATLREIHGGQRLFGHAAPGLMMANGAPAGMPRRARPSFAIPGLRSSSGNSIFRHTDANGLQHRQVFVDDMGRQVAGRLRIEKARGPFAQEVGGKSDDSRRA